jgi:hypothetical protein
VPDELRDAVSRWPERVDHGWRERTHATMLPFSTYGRRRIEASVSDLGMAGVRTSHLRDYDHVVVLGGAGLSPLLRCAYAADVIAANSLAPQAIWLLGSPRPVTTTERQRSDTYAPGASDEFDLMSAAGQRVFSRQTGRHEAVCGCADLATACPQWQNRWGHLEASVRADTDVRLQHRRRASLTGGGVEVHVLSASTSQPPRRPNTGDTYELLAELAHLDDNSRVLVVTGQQFVPFQTFDAIRLLHVPHGCHVDAVGHDAADTDRVHDVGHTLQEVLSALRSARRLGEAVSR